MEEKLALRPGFTFSPHDLVPVNGGGMQLRTGAPGTQAVLDLAPPRIVAPWEGQPADRYTLLNWKHSKEIHAKMEWITENVPGHKSLQKIMDLALLPYIDQLITKHYKPE
jgi:hypothetical protein